MEELSFERRPGVALPLLRSTPHPCSYLPGRAASELFAFGPGIGAETYQRLMDLGFRRAGRVYYRPECPGCAACQPLRVPVATFAPTRSQRRVQRRNADIEVALGPLCDDDEHFDLYRRYVAAQHGERATPDREEFSRSFCASDINTMEMRYRAAGELVGVGVIDITPIAISSVYFYWAPNHAARSLGVYSVLCEIAECRHRRLPYWYAGYMIRGCRKMEYKAGFGPYEILGPDGLWQAETVRMKP